MVQEVAQEVEEEETVETMAVAVADEAGGGGGWHLAGKQTAFPTGTTTRPLSMPEKPAIRGRAYILSSAAAISTYSPSSSTFGKGASGPPAIFEKMTRPLALTSNALMRGKRRRPSDGVGRRLACQSFGT